MNILFVLYGDFSSNTANPLTLFARELSRRGHSCAIAIPSNLASLHHHDCSAFRPLLYQDVLSSPSAVFPNNQEADVIHACTPREVVRKFLTRYMAKVPTPLVVYLEDNELWISSRVLGIDRKVLLQYSESDLSNMIPLSLSHPMYAGCMVGVADAVGVIQDKLKTFVPSWVPCETVMHGIDLEFFYPRTPDSTLREKYGLEETEKILVYPGGINDCTRPEIQNLCEAVGLINQRGFRCRLIRTGLSPLDFYSVLSPAARDCLLDLGVVPKKDIPDLMALADVLVQPGRHNPYEDLRLPGKVPEFLAMGKPVILPETNISYLLNEEKAVILLYDGSPEEIAGKCIAVFRDSQKAKWMGQAGRLFSERNFDIRDQAVKLEALYGLACQNFNRTIASEVWQTEDLDFSPLFRLDKKLELLGLAKQTETLRFGDLLESYAHSLLNPSRRDIKQQEFGSIRRLVSRGLKIPGALISKIFRRLMGIGEFEDDFKFMFKKGQGIYRREGWRGLQSRVAKKLYRRLSL